jgi:hypothetical protein
VVLRRDGFLHLENELALGPDIIGDTDDLSASGDVVVVRDRRAKARLLLHNHAVAMTDELVDTCRGDCHPVLMILDLARDADLHC